MDCSAFQGSHSVSCRFATASWKGCRRGTAAFHDNETLDDIHKTDPLGNIRHSAWDWSNFGCSRSSRSWTENNSLLRRSSPDIAKQPFPKPCKGCFFGRGMLLAFTNAGVFWIRNTSKNQYIRIEGSDSESTTVILEIYILHTKNIHPYILSYAVIRFIIQGLLSRQGHKGFSGDLPLVVGNSFWKVWPKAQPWVWPRKCWSIKETPFKNFQKNFGMNES